MTDINRNNTQYCRYDRYNQTIPDIADMTGQKAQYSRFWYQNSMADTGTVTEIPNHAYYLNIFHL